MHVGLGINNALKFVPQLQVILYDNNGSLHKTIGSGLRQCQRLPISPLKIFANPQCAWKPVVAGRPDGRTSNQNNSKTHSLKTPPRFPVFPFIGKGEAPKLACWLKYILQNCKIKFQDFRRDSKLFGRRENCQQGQFNGVCCTNQSRSGSVLRTLTFIKVTYATGWLAN